MGDSEQMKRTPMQRKTPLLPGQGFKQKAEPKAAKPRQKKCKVRECRKSFLPDAPFVDWCSPECGAVLAQMKLAAIKAKKQRQERAEDKAKRESLKRRGELVAEAQKAFNEFIRLRDAGKPCICCGRTETKVQGLGSHGWDCGHYRSVGSAPQHRFNEDNAHRQLVFCNRNRAGNAVDYRIGLIARIGLDRVEAIEQQNERVKWTHDELRSIKANYQARVREMKKESA